MKKVIMLFLVFGFMLNLTAQKRINLDTLNIDQLNVYKDEAVKKISVGHKVIGTGVGILAAGLITTVILRETVSEDLGLESVIIVLAPAFIGIYVGIPTAIVGILLSIDGSIGKSKAEIAIQKFNIVPENSMALGLGITFRF